MQPTKAIFSIAIHAIFVILCSFQVIAQNSVEVITHLDENGGNPSSNIVTSKTYYDGLGRPIQDLYIQASPDQKDIVQHYDYDNAGRPKFNYLPFKANQTSGNLTPNADQQTIDYYTSAPSNVASTPYPFAETEYENSPINRIKKQGAIGESWQFKPNDQSNEHVANFTYKLSSCSDNVLVFDDIPTYGKNFPKYDDNKLYKLVTSNENGNVVINFKDRLGRLIMTREVMISISQDGVGREVFADTYYIYNSFGLVKAVLQPEGSKLFSISDGCDGNGVATFGINGVSINEFLFKFEYDERRRLVKKNVTSNHGNNEFYVYDRLNRLRLKTNSQLASEGKWEFYKYDKFNRQIISGLYQFNTNSTSETETSQFAAVLTAFIDLYPLNEEIQSIYTNQSFPTTSTDTHIINYFDDYTFHPSIDISQPEYAFIPNSPHSTSATYNTKVKGLLTASMVKILNPLPGINVDWLITVNYYDDYYRLTQSCSNNHLGGHERFFANLSFTGNVLSSRHEHNIPTESHVVEKEYEYDHQERLVNTKIQVDNDPQVKMAEYKYNDLGQLYQKNLHETYGTNSCYLQSIDYKYNERGWLTDINDVELTRSCYTNADLITLLTDVLVNNVPTRPDKETTAGPTGGSGPTVISSTGRPRNAKTGRALSKIDDLVNIFGIAQQDSIIAAAIDSAVYIIKSDPNIFNVEDSLVEERINQISSQVLDRLSIRCFVKNKDLFAERLTYTGEQDGYNLTAALQSEAQFNGNIAQVEWVGVNKRQRGYGYKYDDFDRLTEATYNSFGTRCHWNVLTEQNQHYSVRNINYDLNDNITTLSRKGIKKVNGNYSGFGLVDDLKYHYFGNRLVGVDDEATVIGDNDFKEIGTSANPYTFAYNAAFDYSQTNYQAGVGSEYQYDKFGNLTTDKNKDLQINYNLFNQPTSITVEGTKTIEWMYDAVGNKLAKKAPTATNTIYEKHYIGPFEYVKKRIKHVPPLLSPTSRPTTGQPTLIISGNPVLTNRTRYELEAYYHEEGRLTPAPRDNNNLWDWWYEYNITDHLGNVRVTFTDTNYDGVVEPLQENAYYPFGLNITTLGGVFNGGEMKYQTSGEEVDNYGLSLKHTFFRINDPHLGRWWQNDPLDMLYPEHSPYNSMNNNPISNIDPLGNTPFNFLTAAAGAAFGALIGGEIASKRGKDVGSGQLKGAILGALAGVFINGGGGGAGAVTTAATLAVTSGVTNNLVNPPHATVQNNVVGRFQWPEQDPIVTASVGGDDWVKYSDGTIRRIGKTGGDVKDYIHTFNAAAADFVLMEVVDVEIDLMNLNQGPLIDVSSGGLLGSPGYRWNPSSQAAELDGAEEIVIDVVATIATGGLYPLAKLGIKGAAMYFARTQADDALGGGLSLGMRFLKKRKPKRKPTELWEVSTYKDLRVNPTKNIDAHHVGQKALMKKFIPDYNWKNAPSIAVPTIGHRIKGPKGIVSRSIKGVSNVRNLIARDIKELRRVYGSQGIPNSSLQQLIQLNKSMYPNAFIKK